MTNEELVTRFAREYQKYNRISEERAKQQQSLLVAFGATLNGTLADATANDLQEFAGQLLDSGLHVNTVRKKLNMIRPFYSWAYAAKQISAEAYMELRSVKDPRGATSRTRPKPYTRKELDEFWSEVDSRYPLLPEKGARSQALKRWLQGKGPWGKVYRHAFRLQLEAMVRLALDLGLRRSEIFGLSVNDLHYDNEYIVIRGKADPNTGEPKIRDVPFTNEARRTLKTWLEFRAYLRLDHDRPWISLRGQAAGHPMCDDRFAKLLQKAVGPKWAWHRFRHTCATEWLRAGADLEIVSELLGHANLQQTLAYAQILKSDVAKKLGAVEGAFSEAVTNRAA